MACLAIAGNARLQNLCPENVASGRILFESERLGKPVRFLAGAGAGSSGLGRRSGCGAAQGLSTTGLGVRARGLASLKAVADLGVGEAVVEEEGTIEAEKVEYNWEREWYPLYLLKEVPTDAPLGLTVFDRPLVLYYDGKGALHCLEDRCPHRAAKLSEGQVADGRLECLYHGWQFEGDGSCAKIPQLPAGAKIPRAACARSYAIRESQGVVWVWMGDKESADSKKIPWFEHYASEGFQDISVVHELPYDYSILLENLMDPAHIPISHDRTDPSAKREDAQAMVFQVTERTDRGFAGEWKTGEAVSTMRFEAPCSLRSEKQLPSKDGKELWFSGVFLCRPAGQGKSMLIARFGTSGAVSSGLGQAALRKLLPVWLIHSTGSTVFEQDMGFLASQNEILVRRGVATKDLYINLRSCDTWILELRKWMDLVGHGMPYYIGHRTSSPPLTSAMFETAPVGPVAAAASSYPAKGAFGHLYARDLTNRYYRHVVHCNECRSALTNFQKYQEASLIGGVISAGAAILAESAVWRTSLVALALVLFVTSWGCSKAQAIFTVNFVREHRK